MFRTILIDDEKLAVARLERLLAKFADTFEIVGRANNGAEGFSLIESLKPDLIFLDIEMPVMNGFEMLSKLGHVPMVVFATAFDELPRASARGFVEIQFRLEPKVKNKYINRLQLKFGSAEAGKL